MKKLLSLLFTLILIAIVSGGFFVAHRWTKNPVSVVPYPYGFTFKSQALKPDAPILIVGDRMGAYFGRFKEEMAETISKNLDNVIKIQSIAKEGEGIHRTLHQLKSLSQWPQIIIYQGGSEEFSEEKFEISEIKTITENFKLYQDERIQTLLILYPWLSKIVYTPIKRIPLKENPVLKTEITEAEYLRKLQTELLLYEEHLNQLVNMAKDRNSLLILTTTPINLDVEPKSTCSFSTTTDVEVAINDLKELIKKGDRKMGWQTATKLTSQYPGNPMLYHLQGVIGKQAGKIPEAINSMLQASSYECTSWRATELQNSIIRRVANSQQVILFDFSRMIEKDWNNNILFFDEIYPQNIYYDRGMKQLGMVIRQILKL